ncbi:ATP-binding protein [Neptunicella marina]|uniref:histidine kinase n=1 Tax=Neptunicella marina TaxID=2125989 RepID=A0A8J6LZH0_9ALTE|nr:ATP-binding protein [Neptunicella marina]MBC3766130.1 HAMP domain-containing histidine kinase [Neptunicella marina]
MTEGNSILSIKSLMLYVAMATSTLALVVTAGIFEYRLEKSYKDELIEDTKMFADFLVNNSVASVLFKDAGAAQSDLAHLEGIAHVDHAHIYYFGDDQELTLFATYNRSGTGHVQTVIDRVDELSEPTMSSSGMEFVKPITHKGDIIGYLYINMSLARLNELKLNAIMLTVAILFVVIALCLALALVLQKKITKPVEELVELVQKISRDKDYSTRAEVCNISELAIFANAFNRLLARMQQHIQQQQQAEDEYRELTANLEEKVNQRTIALKQANHELMQTLEKLHEFQRQLVQNEKMASLGDMVAGIAHEVNTPIGLGVTASTMMIDRINKIQHEFDNKTLKASSLEKFLNESRENLNIVYRNLNRSADLISSFKQVAVDQTHELNRTFNVGELIDEILFSLRPRLKQTEHEVLVHCDSELMVECKAGPIHQILINLILNSLIHGFEYIDIGTIEIKVEMVAQQQLQITYTDNGKGLSDDLKKRIFDPFVTTKRGKGGSGLGMHLVFNLVTQGLGGNISVDSKEGQGVKFIIQFPVNRMLKNSDQTGKNR